MVVRKACLWGESLFFADQQKVTEGVVNEYEDPDFSNLICALGI
jgi:hypothetical protein